MRRADLFRPLGDGRVQCTACARLCRVGIGQIGLCGIRKNVGGELVLLSYGRVIAGNIDPIEKKPVVHYRPGSRIFSVATTGCNWLCHPGDALLLMSDGSTNRIKDVRVGDTLVSIDFSMGFRLSHSRVAAIGKRTAEVWEISAGVGGEHILELTGEHPVFTKEGWKQARLLSRGESLLALPDKLGRFKAVSTKQCGRSTPWIDQGVESEGEYAVVTGSARARSQGVNNLLANGQKVSFTTSAGDLDATKLSPAQPLSKSPLTDAWELEWSTVYRVERTGRTKEVYGLECTPHHNYVADGVLVHNCRYCQNNDISQRRVVGGVEVTPSQLVSTAKKLGCQGIAYTYNEPTIFMEFAKEIGEEAHRQGLFNIFVSNGYATAESAKYASEFLDCITVDFKGSGEEKFVQRYIGIPNAQPVFETLKALRRIGKTHIEVTDLVVPGVGDSLEAAAHMCKWIVENLGVDTPVHFLRFHPDYRMMDFPYTPAETLEKHFEVAKKAGLRYVYVGNLPGNPHQNTYCPECGAVVVGREGYTITSWNLTHENTCRNCSAKIPIVGGLEPGFDDVRFLPVL